MRTKTTSRRIEWRCNECRRPVADGEGWITIDMREVKAREAAYAEWEARHPGPVVNLRELLELPDEVQWQVFHRECDPNIDATAYWFDIERCRTEAQLLDWCSHLLEKQWLSATAWDDFLRRALGAEAGAA